MRLHSGPRVGAAAGAVVLLLRASPAAGGAPPAARALEASSDDAISEAEKLIREGVELRLKGVEHLALERFQAAHSLQPSARALGHMGLAEKSLRLYVEAASHLEASLAATDDPWVQQNRDALVLARDLVKKQLASLLVRSNVPAAELWVNGAKVASLPMSTPVDVLAGAARIELRAAGHARREERTTLPAEALSEIDLELAPALEAPPLGRTPVASTPARPVAAPSASTTQPSRPLRPWIFASAAVGVTSLGFGTYFGVRALQKKDERDEVCPDPTCPTREGTALDEDARTSANWSTATLAIGGSGVAAALILLVVDLSQASTPAPAVVFAPGPDGVVFGARLAL